jgi:hypothetical protein
MGEEWNNMKRVKEGILDISECFCRCRACDSGGEAKLAVVGSATKDSGAHWVRVGVGERNVAKPGFLDG